MAAIDEPFKMLRRMETSFPFLDFSFTNIPLLLHYSATPIIPISLWIPLWEEVMEWQETQRHIPLSRLHNDDRFSIFIPFSYFIHKHNHLILKEKRTSQIYINIPYKVNRLTPQRRKSLFSVKWTTVVQKTSLFPFYG